MKYIKEIMELNIFTYEDALGVIGTEKNTSRVLNNMIKEGYISKIKKGFYCANDLVNLIPSANKYEIICNLDADNFISHHSVFEYYGIYNQVYNAVDYSNKKTIADFCFDSNEYICHKSKTNVQVNYLNGIKVTTMERAIIDMIDDSKNYEFEELIECISMLDKININNINEYLKELNNKVLYKKVGYVLSLFKDKFNLPDDYFEELKINGGSSRAYYNNSKKDVSMYNAYWQLYVLKGDAHV